MKPFAFLLLVVAALPLPAASAAASGDLLVRMAAVNPGLHAFTATLHADVVMKSFPFLSASLVGTLYHKEPNKDKVVFTSGVPVIAQQFDQLYAHMESPSRWPDVYGITVVGDDGRVTTFKLTPRKKGNVDHIDAKVSDVNATVESMRWDYANGGYAEMNDTYAQVGSDTLVTSQSGHVEEPGYTADIHTSIDNYKLNPSLSDSIFEQ